MGASLYVTLSGGGHFYHHLGILAAIELAARLGRELFVSNDDTLFHYAPYYLRREVPDLPWVSVDEATPPRPSALARLEGDLQLCNFTNFSYVEDYRGDLRHPVYRALRPPESCRTLVEQVLARLGTRFHAVQLRTDADWLRVCGSRSSIAFVSEAAIARFILDRGTPRDLPLLVVGSEVHEERVVSALAAIFAVVTKGDLTARCTPHQRAVIEYFLCLQSEVFTGNLFSSFYFSLKEHRSLAGRPTHYYNPLREPAPRDLGISDGELACIKLTDLYVRDQTRFQEVDRRYLRAPPLELEELLAGVPEICAPRP